MTLLGWALMHSLWQGLVIALGLASVLALTRSARIRYAAGLASMTLMAVVFAITLVFSGPETMPGTTGPMAPSDVSFLPSSSDRTLRGVAPSPLDFMAPYISMFWLAGVCVCHLWQLAGLASMRRWRSRGNWPAMEEWEQRLRGLARQLEVTKPVALLESIVVNTPVTVGHLRPLILVPVGMLARLPANQVEAILLHELAHIRRYDYLVNLMQRWIEGLFFYHPAMWWISHVVRLEREACCDDLAAAATGDRRQYAGALVALEESRFSAQDSPALAATGGSLRVRIDRLLRQSPTSPARGLVSFLTIVAGASALAFAGWQTRTIESPKTEPLSTVSQKTEKAPVRIAQFAPAKPKPSPSSVEVSTPWQKWLNEDVVYLITDAERAAFNQLQTDEERRRFVEQFWEQQFLRRQLQKEEHYRRIGYANERFGAGDMPGWQTDRGRIYIISGPPAEIESHAIQGGRPAYSVWLYKAVPNGQSERFYTFADVSNTGDYRLQTSETGQQAAVFSRTLRWTVVDPWNRFVTGLTLEHFVLRENGQARSITYFEAPGTPTVVAVVSGSDLPDLDSLPLDEPVRQTRTIADAVGKLRSSSAVRKVLIIVGGLGPTAGAPIPGGITTLIVDASMVRRTIVEVANQYVAGYNSDSAGEPELLVKPVSGLPALRIGGR